MQLKFRFYDGGNINPFVAKAKEAYEKVTKERLAKDPEKKMDFSEVLSSLESYPEYARLKSLAAFWEGERRLWADRLTAAVTIEDVWKDAHSEKGIGDFIEETEADEIDKAMCYYMALDHHRRNPDDDLVDFRLYFTEKNATVPSTRPVAPVYEG